jgi:hypothetical protein
MKKCASPDHPFCTQWVKPGESVCASNHPQPLASAISREPLNREQVLRAASMRPRAFVAADDGPSAAPLNGVKPDAGQPHLHLSGFDPRAAGGRQIIKIELMGMPAEAGAQMEMTLLSDLIPGGSARHVFVRATSGHWRPVVAEFSSKNKEHGQYRMEVELKHKSRIPTNQRWVCTPVILVPRPDASLTDIHQIFLGTHKNVKVVVDDASIAKLSGYAPSNSGGDIDITATNASIAHVDLSAPKGKVDVGFSTIAWDEDLIEIDVSSAIGSHPHLSHSACLVAPAAPRAKSAPAAGAGPNAGSHASTATPAGAGAHLRLFALAQCTLGRFQQIDPEADILLAHYSANGPESEGLTRRISARHAIIRRTGGGFEIEDVSRYGILLDDKWPGKSKPSPLRTGMKIELSASFKNVATLQVAALLPHALILRRQDAGAQAESLYLIAPELRPELPHGFQLPRTMAGLPLLFHHHGGFWHLDPDSGKETALTPGMALTSLRGISPGSQFEGAPYPDCRVVGYASWREHMLPDADANAAMQTM